MTHWNDVNEVLFGFVDFRMELIDKKESVVVQTTK
jgi:hypothetical protein